MAWVESYNRSAYTISVAIYGLQYDASEYDQFWYSRDGGQTGWLSSQASYTFDGLTPNTTYPIQAQAQYEGVWYVVGNCSDTTDNLTLPTDVNTSVDGKAITVFFTPGEGAFITRLWKTWDGGSGIYTYESSFAFTVPDYNTTYYFQLQTENSWGEKTDWSEWYPFTSGTSARPDSFEWDVAKVSGEDVNVTATEWNKFTVRINEFRQYKELTDYVFTTVATGDAISAVIFNQAIGAIMPMYTTYGDMQAGWDIYADYFNNIRDHLNSIE